MIAPVLPSDEPLTVAHLHHRDIAQATHTPQWRRSIEEQMALLAAVKSGDREALDIVAIDMQSYIHYWASRLSRAYAWASPRIDYPELLGQGNLVFMESLERAYTNKEAPFAYLASCIKWGMRNYCHRYATLIACPDGVDNRYTVESLDRPAFRDEDAESLADRIAGPDIQLPEREHLSSSQPDARALSHALSLLSEQYQQVLTRWYGLGEQSPEEQARDISQNLTDRVIARQAVYAIHDAACDRLRVILQAPRDEEGRPDLYTTKQVQHLIGLPPETCRSLLPKKHIQPFAPMLYRKSEIDALLRERVPMLAERAKSPEQRQAEYKQRERERTARKRALKRLQPETPEERARYQQQRQEAHARYRAKLQIDPEARARYLEAKARYRAKKRAQQQAQ